MGFYLMTIGLPCWVRVHFNDHKIWYRLRLLSNFSMSLDNLLISDWFPIDSWVLCESLKSHNFWRIDCGILGLKTERDINKRKGEIYLQNATIGIWMPLDFKVFPDYNNRNLLFSRLLCNGKFRCKCMVFRHWQQTCKPQRVFVYRCWESFLPFLTQNDNIVFGL